MKERLGQLSAKEFEEDADHLINLLSEQTLSYLTKKFKHGIPYDYVLNLVVHSHVSSLIKSMLSISGNNLEVRESVVTFIENILDNFGYRIKDFKDIKIN